MNKETIKIKDDQLKTQILSTQNPLNNGKSQYSASQEEQVRRRSISIKRKDLTKTIMNRGRDDFKNKKSQGN